MENITLEKVIKFDSLVDSIETINVSDELKYELSDDNTHASGTILIYGSVNTLNGMQSFNEEVDVDIYAPLEKKIDKDNFKIVVKDYSYVVNKQNLNIYLVISIEGIVENDDKIDSDDNDSEVLEVDYDNIVNSNNNINDINTSDENTRNRNLKDNNDNNKIVVEENKTNNIKLKDSDKNESVSSNWGTDLFKLTDTYTLFDKFHIE